MHTLTDLFSYLPAAVFFFTVNNDLFNSHRLACVLCDVYTLQLNDYIMQYDVMFTCIAHGLNLVTRLQHQQFNG